MIAAIYVRKSTDQNLPDAEKSVARQIEHATAYAARKGWTVAPAHIYGDDAISGAEFQRRPGFLRLMNALKPQPAFQVQVMMDEDRLGREQIETAYALKQLICAGSACSRTSRTASGRWTPPLKSSCSLCPPSRMR
jgi:DNA invertase Pin-like site-specific DNA recombinase